MGGRGRLREKGACIGDRCRAPERLLTPFSVLPFSQTATTWRARQRLMAAPGENHAARIVLPPHAKLIPLSLLSIAPSVTPSWWGDEGAVIGSDRRRCGRSPIPLAIRARGRRQGRATGGTHLSFRRPDGDFSDGTVWAFGKSGRPPALLTISLNKYPPTTIFGLLEFTSIADGPVRVDGKRSPWSPEKPGIEARPIPDGSRPADDAPKRLLQMRELSRRFGGHELFEPAKEGGRPDQSGAASSPETGASVSRRRGGASLTGGPVPPCSTAGTRRAHRCFVEAVSGDRDEKRWVYGLGRISSAHLKVNLDGREVADFPCNSPATPPPTSTA